MAEFWFDNNVVSSSSRSAVSLNWIDRFSQCCQWIGLGLRFSLVRSVGPISMKDSICSETAVHIHAPWDGTTLFGLERQIGFAHALVRVAKNKRKKKLLKTNPHLPMYGYVMVMIMMNIRSTAAASANSMFQSEIVSDRGVVTLCCTKQLHAIDEYCARRLTLKIRIRTMAQSESNAKHASHQTARWTRSNVLRLKLQMNFGIKLWIVGSTAYRTLTATDRQYLLLMLLKVHSIRTFLFLFNDRMAHNQITNSWIYQVVWSMVFVARFPQ